MRRMTVRRMVTSGLAVAVALAALPALTAPAFAAEKAPNDRLLPPRTYLYVTVPSVGELKSRFDKSLTGKLLKDPKLADFLGDIHKKFAQLDERFQKNIGLKIEDVLAIPDGELSIAVMQPSESTKLAVAGILDFGKSQSAVNTLLEKTASALEKEGFKKTTKEIERAQVMVFTREKSKDKDKDSSDSKSEGSEPDFGSQFAYVIKEETLLFTTSATAVKDILARWDGKHAETLAESPSYKAVAEAAKKGGSAPVLVWYVDPITLVQAIMANVGGGDPTVGMVMGFLPALGITNFKAVGGGVHLATEDFDFESRTLIYLDQPASGLLSIFQFPAIDEAPPKWVTEDSTAYFAINWDIPKAYSAVEAIADQFLGPGATAQKLDEFAQQEEFGKIHLKKDVLDNLTGMFHVVTDVPDPNKAESSRFLLAVSVKDSKKAKSVLEKVAKLPHFPGQPRDFKGDTIYNLEGNALFGDANRTMGIAVVNDNIMFSNDVGRIEQAILGDKDRKPLADSDKYKAIAKHFPAKTSILGYQNSDTQLKTIYEMFRSGKISERVAETDFGKILEGIDFKKLPEFDVIEKYLPPSGSYIVPQGNGAVFVSFTLKTTNK